VLRPNLYILGLEDSDTDEYDDHVVAHEFGHYLEDQLYRSDSIGGSHSLADLLDPRVAFGEGFGNAISGMTFNNPLYIDTAGVDQASGFSVNVSLPPSAAYRGIYNEWSAQYFLWSLFSNRGAKYDRIHTVLESDHKVTPALTSLHSFAAYYRNRFGATAENLGTLWSSSLASPLNALCIGGCPSSVGGTLDLFDSDGDLGSAYASILKYPATANGAVKSADFWKVYGSLVAGTNPSSRNTTLAGGYSYSLNKMGMNRWYRYRHSGSNSPVTISVSSVFSLSGSSVSCTTDALDMLVISQGQIVAADESGSGSTAGCPTVTFNATSGADYVVVISGYSGETSSYQVTVLP
jgi:hypothetical protein